MADSTEGDTDIQDLGLLVPALIALIAGLVIHSFIIGVNVTDWWKGRSVTPVDHIVTSLGISRICTQCTVTLYLFFTKLLQISPHSPVTLVLIDAPYSFFTYGNFWLTSLLSIVLCLKISNFDSRLFLYLRRKIVHRTVYWIVGAIFLSAFNCLMPLMTAFTEMIRGQTYNTTIPDISLNYFNINYIFSFTIGALIPLLFYSISSVLLFISLYNHIKIMKISSNLTINLETYYSAMKLICVTFIYNTMYFFGHSVSGFYYYFYSVILESLHIVLDFLPVLHSSYLIYKTAKLRSQVSKVLQNVVDFLFQKKDTETREDIELVAQ
ncbi:hypothetical protein GDO78_022177 [Eleutherodactylus coqui]|uniref:Taste receptor type 2 n=1 Tax=Eleutherodactylus coqui TaxID=57060 RepID=A0A8J6K1L5_ELECQ|nr:hypothetical protein GDO78_022177 [Eleutherodactylus coqui]